VKAQEIRDKSNEELQQMLQERQESLMRFRFNLVTGREENVRAARNARKDIARIKTILRERELGIQRKAK